MTRAERRRQARKETKNNIVYSYNDEFGIFGDVPLDVRVKIALEPCDKLNGKSVADLIVATHQFTDIDGLSEENFGVAIENFIKNS